MAAAASGSKEHMAPVAGWGWRIMQNDAKLLLLADPGSLKGGWGRVAACATPSDAYLQVCISRVDLLVSRQKQHSAVRAVVWLMLPGLPLQQPLCGRCAVPSYACVVSSVQQLCCCLYHMCGVVVVLVPRLMAAS